MDHLQEAPQLLLSPSSEPSTLLSAWAQVTLQSPVISMEGSARPQELQEACLPGRAQFQEMNGSCVFAGPESRSMAPFLQQIGKGDRVWGPEG